jgi:hypothetical protein
VIDTAVDCLFWPLYEVVDGTYRLTYVPPNTVPVADWLALQGRFAHLLRPENAEVVADIQSRVEEDWQALSQLCGGGQRLAAAVAAETSPDRRRREVAQPTVRPPNEITLVAGLTEDVGDLTAAVRTRRKVPGRCQQNGVADSHCRQLRRTINVEHSAR